MDTQNRLEELKSLTVFNDLNDYPMKTDPVTAQIKTSMEIGGMTLTIETPPDLDKLLQKTAKESPQDVDAIPYYSILWPSSIELAEYIYENRDLVKGRRAIELGCGLGLPSILCAKLEADVTATDFHPDSQKWVLYNAGINQTKLKYLQLDWNTFVTAEPDSPLKPAPLVIGSDLIYEKAHIPALVCAITTLCQSGGCAIIADPGRDHLQLFLSAMQKAGWQHTLHTRNEIFILQFVKSNV